MFKAVIFDFNGTLFWDTKLHNEAWDSYLGKYDISLTDRQKHLHLHGKNNRQIALDLFGEDISEAEIEKISREKELLYQQMVQDTRLRLADGVLDLLIFLKDQGIAIAIVTASDKLNVDFFIRYLQLEKWFEASHIIFNDGSMKGKPDPDMFLIAMEKLGCLATETVIFEDSDNGIMAAHLAKPGRLIIVDSASNDYSKWQYQVIRSFHDLDRSIFL